MEPALVHFHASLAAALARGEKEES
jgi:hypothetical protein